MSVNENNPRPDPRRYGATVLDLQRCPGCRRPLDPDNAQEWVSAGVAFCLCRECRGRAKSDLAVVDRIFHVVSDWVEMDAVLAEYRRDHADVL